MKMVKSLLLGSAAGFVAVAGAQAADLPVKAKAVEYVKVCSLYGAGYYYIPGTDTCLKLGGFVRFDTSWHGALSGGTAVLEGANGRRAEGETTDFRWRVRYQLSTDVRTQTEYGTLRSYARAGWQFSTAAGAPAAGDVGAGSKDGNTYYDRAFIQFAGFTVGKSQSSFDSWSAGMGVANSNLIGYSDTGNGITLAAYTAMLGNGISYTGEVLDPEGWHRKGIFNSNAGTLVFGGLPNGVGYGGLERPNFVSTLRVDQAWGTALVSGLVHHLKPNYVNATNGGLGNQQFGTADDDTGWAITGALQLNLPWAKGDRFVITGLYTEGVMGTITEGAGYSSVGLTSQNSGKVTVGWFYDSIHSGVAGSSQELTTGWAIVGGIEHYWTPSLRSSVFGDYLSIEFNDRAKSLLCANFAANNAFTGSCDPDFNIWQVGGRTVWTPVRNLDLSVEGLYTKIEQNNQGTTTLAAGTMQTGVARSFEDKDTWSVNFRVQRNFWP